MKIIVGLGNPGVQYVNTPHSIGFEVVDAIAKECGVEWEDKRQFKCLMARGAFSGQPILLIKPQTFMNLSGESVSPVVRYHNSTVADLLVVHDDIDLALGSLRIRKSGSCGGHNGVRNIIAHLGTEVFTRLKIGVGKNKDDVIGFVLGKFSPDVRKVMDIVVAEAVKAAAEIITNGPDKAMNAYNGFNALIKKGL